MSAPNVPNSDVFPWYVGHAANSTTVYTRREAQSFARGLLTSTAYRDSLEKRLLAGDLPPAVESMLWHYAFGKPIEQVEVSMRQAEQDLSRLSMQELLEKADQLRDALLEAAATEAAIPAEFKQVA